VSSDWKAHFQRIYRTEAVTYQRMVAAEDTLGELAAKLTKLAETATTIVDVGAGTGRLTVPLCVAGNRVHGVDTATAMLDVARTRLARCAGRWALSTADARKLPIDDDWADAAIAGWVFGHFTEWYQPNWEAELVRALAEMDRVVKPGGVEIVVDTLGTGVTVPAAPTPALAAYHQLLEERGFTRDVLRTDYRFGSVEESVELLEWFFGMGDWARAHHDPVVPEYTGWWQRANL
jgi:ubiquinone/menaquinone biosynthesis C-methylase UbiE